MHDSVKEELQGRFYVISYRFSFPISIVFVGPCFIYANN